MLGRSRLATFAGGPITSVHAIAINNFCYVRSNKLLGSGSKLRNDLKRNK